MNLVIDDAIEVKQATKDQPETRRQLGAFHSGRNTIREKADHTDRGLNFSGQILLKGDNVSLIQAMS